MNRQTKLSPQEQRVLDIHERLENWNSFVRALDIPADIAPAFMTERVELMRLARPRVLTEVECKVLYDLIGGLLETNMTLREHAQAVADVAATIHQGIKGALHGADRMRRLANFTDPREFEEGDGA